MCYICAFSDPRIMGETSKLPKTDVRHKIRFIPILSKEAMRLWVRLSATFCDNYQFSRQSWFFSSVLSNRVHFFFFFFPFYRSSQFEVFSSKTSFSVGHHLQDLTTTKVRSGEFIDISILLPINFGKEKKRVN